MWKSYAVCSIPSSDEDASFIFNSTLGVADGVGGYREVGIDPSIYPRILMGEMSKMAHLSSDKNLLDQLKVCHNKISELKIPGGSTICLTRLFTDQTDHANGDKLKLETLNVGDSGFRIFSKVGILKYSSKIQRSGFNAPIYLSGDSEVETIFETTIQDVEKGDFVLLATDGLFDNLFDSVIESVIIHHIARLKFLNDYAGTRNISDDDVEVNIVDLVEDIGEMAENFSRGKRTCTPFNVEAKKFGFEPLDGGKLDDITIVLAQV